MRTLLAGLVMIAATLATASAVDAAGNPGKGSTKSKPGKHDHKDDKHDRDKKHHKHRHDKGGFFPNILDLFPQPQVTPGDVPEDDTTLVPSDTKKPQNPMDDDDDDDDDDD
jgi:hypothetical protein